MKKNVTLILLLTTILLTALLSLANMQAVEINYLFGSFRTPLILLILISVLLGFLIQMLINLPKSLSYRQQLKQLHKQVQDKTLELQTNLTDKKDKSTLEKEEH